MIRFDEWLEQNKNHYQIVIDVTTNRELSTFELENLHYALQLQIDEPVDLEGEDESWRVVDSSFKIERI
jgi:hypothetical protein